MGYKPWHAAAVALWLFTHSETAQIKRVFADIERLAAKMPGEPVMECAMKAQSLARGVYRREKGMPFRNPDPHLLSRRPNDM